MTQVQSLTEVLHNNSTFITKNVCACACMFPHMQSAQKCEIVQVAQHDSRPCIITLNTIKQLSNSVTKMKTSLSYLISVLQVATRNEFIFYAFQHVLVCLMQYNFGNSISHILLEVAPRLTAIR